MEIRLGEGSEVEVVSMVVVDSCLQWLTDTQMIEYGHQIRTVYGRKQTVYGHIRLYLYRLRTVFCRKPDR